MEPSDNLLGLLPAFSRLVHCSLPPTRDQVTDFKICIFIYVLFLAFLSLESFGNWAGQVYT